MQKKTIDGIRNVETVRDPSGQADEVESGGKKYWADRQGQYIRSDAPTCDPNQDLSVNDADWVAADPE